MKIIIYKNNGIIDEVDCSYLFESTLNNWNVVFSMETAVKEIEFCHTIQDEAEVLFKPIYTQLNQHHPMEIKKIILYFNEAVQFEFKCQIKAFLYRHTGYGQGGNYVIQERLSIRFQEDGEPIFDLNNYMAYCSPNCPYKNNNYCLKYKTNLETKAVCKVCFLDNVNYYFQDMKNMFYDNMIGKEYHYKFLTNLLNFRAMIFN